MKSIELIKKEELSIKPINEEGQTKKEREGKSLIYIKSAECGEVIRLDTLIRDFSDYETLSFYVYSEQADGKELEVRLYNPIGEHTLPDKPRYSHIKVKRDFVGLKRFEYRIATLGSPVPFASHRDFVYLTLHINEKQEGRVENIEIGEFELKGYSYELSESASPSDFELIKKRVKSSIVGDGGDELLSHPLFKERLEKIEKEAKASWELFKSTYPWEKDVCFDKKIKIEALEGERVIASGYTKLSAMAKGYAARGTELYHNPELLSDIIKGLDFLYDNYYGECISDKGIWGNWWTWQIGIPGEVVTILILLEDSLSKEQIEKYLYPVDYYLPYPTMTACNKMWRGHRCILAAALHGDAKRIVRARKMLLDIFEYVKSGDGFYDDGSFVQHNWHAYTGGYGLGLLSTAVTLCYLLSGTRFAFDEPVTDNQYRWVKETFIPSMYKGRLFSSLRGREVSRATSELAAARSALSAFVKMSTYAPPEVNRRVLPVIKDFLLSNDGDTLYSSVSSELIMLLDRIASDEGIGSEKFDTGVKSFARVDRVAMRGENYGACASLTSLSRTLKYESINRENKTGWYLSDGMIQFYNGEYDYDKDFFYYANPYRLPGVTANASPRVAECFQYSIRNGNDFAGGVEGAFGIAALDLEYTPGGKFFECDLKARKSYFFFVSEVVAITTAISDSSGEEVYTTHENRKWKESERLYIDGEPVALGEEEKEYKAEYIYFDGFGGYVFPKGEKLKLAKKTENYDFCPLGRQAEERDDKISGVSFLEIIKSHGKNPIRECGICVYLPEATLEQTKEYSESPRAKILEATDEVHAVICDGRLAVCFFEAGKSEVGITSSEALLLTLSVKDGRVRLAVCDPTQTLTRAALTLDEKALSELLGTEPDFAMAEGERFSVKKDNGFIKVEVNLENNLGRTYELK